MSNNEDIDDGGRKKQQAKFKLQTGSKKIARLNQR